jgi:hypothetical protein
MNSIEPRSLEALDELIVLYKKLIDIGFHQKQIPSTIIECYIKNINRLLQTIRAITNNRPMVDYFTISIIARTIYEAYLHLSYFTDENIDSDERGFRVLIWKRFYLKESIDLYNDMAR